MNWFPNLNYVFTYYSWKLPTIPCNYAKFAWLLQSCSGSVVSPCPAPARFFLYCTVLYCTALHCTVLTLPSTCLPVLLLKGAVMVTEPAVASSILRIEPGNPTCPQFRYREDSISNIFAYPLCFKTKAGEEIREILSLFFINWIDGMNPRAQVSMLNNLNSK